MKHFAPQRISNAARTAALLAVAAAPLALSPPPVLAYTTRHVLIVVIDGARYSETFGDATHQWTPRQQIDLAPISCRPDTFLNNGVTNTNPGMASILTGTWQAIPNDGSEPPHAPTLFEYYRSATGEPASKAWLIAEKTKIAALASSDHPSYGPAYGASVDVTHQGDPQNLSAALEALHRDLATAVVVNLGHVDWYGHLNDWSLYTRQIQITDSLVFEAWNSIQADTALAGRTTLIVTNDHGRHDDAHGGFVNHGCSCWGCRRIQFLALGPDWKAGFVSDQVYRQIDVLPTVAKLLAFPVPESYGSPMYDLLVDPQIPLAVSPETGRAALSLSPPVPNPGRSIRFSVRRADASPVRVEVLDLQGRAIATLHRGPANPAVWLEWGGRTSSGRAAPAGMYVVRASGAGEVASRRVFLLR